MGELNFFELQNLNNIKYFEHLRDSSLERFINKIKKNLFSDEEYHKSLDIVLRNNKQLKMIEDIAVVNAITSK